MKKMSIYNLISSLIMLIIGIILITNPDALIGIVSWIVGSLLIFAGLIKAILSFKNNELNTPSLYISIIIFIIGIFIISFPQIMNVTIKILFGGWILFAGIQRLAFSLLIKAVDNKGFKTYLLTSLIIIIVGVLVLINFYNLLGYLLSFYAVLEIINYVYYVVHRTDYSDIINAEPIKLKNKKVPKSMKEKKAVDADIEE